MCIDHCAKITANNTHRFDDICDTLYDAVKLALIDKTIIGMRVSKQNESQKKILDGLVQINQNRKRLRRASVW